MSFNYLTIGYNCSPAAALKNLNLRKYALPFDWTISSVTALEKCFESNFENFHKKLVLNYNKSILIDYYNFEFPHDYPRTQTQMTDVVDNIGEGLFPEDNGTSILDNWNDYYEIVLEKYNRRIERFKNIINDIKPIIVLCRYNTIDVLKLQNIFKKYYNLDNIYFVNSSREIFENDKIKNIYTEQNNEWNDVNIWKQGINDIIKKINYTL